MQPSQKTLAITLSASDMSTLMLLLADWWLLQETVHHSDLWKVIRH